VLRLYKHSITNVSVHNPKNIFWVTITTDYNSQKGTLTPPNVTESSTAQVLQIVKFMPKQNTALSIAIYLNPVASDALLSYIF